MCGHKVQFYDTEVFLVRKVFDFVGEALRAGKAAIVIATGPHRRQLDALMEEQALLPQGLPAGHGPLIRLDAEETLAHFMVDGMPDAARFAQTIGVLLDEAAGPGGRPVSAFGEMVAVLYMQGNVDAAVRLEQLWEDLGRRRVFDLLCAYPMSVFPDEGHRGAFQAICEAHTQVAPLEYLEGVAMEPEALHRVVARLQQSANALEHELARRRRSDRLLDRQAARITAMERAQAALKDLAGHDALTGLSNRRAFGECLAQAFARARRLGSHVALLFIDLDDFKILNDRFGHQAGDGLLREVAVRLGACVRMSDTVCRIGGDEFTVVMEDADASQAAMLAQRIVDTLTEPFLVGSDEVRMTASVGLGLYPDDASDAQGLIRSADKAMYRAKALGKSRFVDPHRPPAPAVAAAALPEPPQEAAAAAEAGAAAEDAPLGGVHGATTWMTVASAALQLGLSRPHVVKLIAERRFADVVRQDGALPLIPASEVSRVGRELQLGGCPAMIS